MVPSSSSTRSARAALAVANLSTAASGIPDFTKSASSRCAEKGEKNSPVDGWSVPKVIRCPPPMSKKRLTSFCLTW